MKKNRLVRVILMFVLAVVAIRYWRRDNQQAVSNHQEPCGILHPVVGKDARALLGPDAGRVTQHQSKNGKRVAIRHRSLASVKT